MLHTQIYTVTESFAGCPTTNIYPTKEEQTIAIQHLIADYEKAGYSLIFLNPLEGHDDFGNLMLRKDSTDIVAQWASHFISIDEKDIIK